MAYKVVSIARYRAHASEQRRRGLKIGGTMSILAVSNGVEERYINAYGANPADRRKYAIAAFERGEGTKYYRDATMA